MEAFSLLVKTDFKKNGGRRFGIGSLFRGAK